MLLWKLLSSSSSAAEDPKNLSFWDKYGMMIILGGFFLLLVLFMVWSSSKRRKQQEEMVEKINSLKAGTKIETIGGIFGTIVEMNKKDGTFILETGSDKFGKTYMTFDRNAIARIIDPIMAADNVQEDVVEEDAAPEFEPVKQHVAEEKQEENKD